MTTVFLHAFPFDPRMWERQRRLAPGSAAPLLYELGETMDEWAEAILERHPGELVLVGASMGGYAAYHLARLAPERVRGLVAAGARPQADSAEARRRRDRLIALVEEQGLEALWEEIRPQTFSRDVSATLLEQARGWVVEQDPAHVVRGLRALRDRRDTSEPLAALDPQALVVLGELDEIARPADFEGVVSGERVRVVREAGHLPNLERPDRFDPILEEALQTWRR